MTRNLSIVIPTHNRRPTLLRALEGYARQTAGDRITEILVVDDGSTDGTEEAVLGHRLARKLSVRCLRQECRGAAAARNHGIRESRGEIILFTDDDIIPDPSLVAEHLSWHDKNAAASDAVLGYVTWSPEVNPTPFMEWLARDGVITGYAHIRTGQQVSCGYFYACNISLKREFLIQSGMFDEAFHGYGFEDAELGSRLAQKGLRLLYNAGAIGFHYRSVSYADIRRRTEAVVLASQIYMERAGRRGEARAASIPRRMLRRVARVASPAMPLITPLLDTQIPLPAPIYSAIYHHHLVPRAQALCRVASARGRKAAS